jgi:hypothetical protein
MLAVDPDLPGDLQDVVGDSLRVVATHAQHDYAFHFQREDIRAGYTDDEFQRIFDDLVLEGMERQHFEGLFHVGQLECGAWGFEEAAVFYFPSMEYSGLVVSVDRDGPIDLDGLIEVCTAGIVDGDA